MYLFFHEIPNLYRGNRKLDYESPHIKQFGKLELKRTLEIFRSEDKVVK